MNCPRCDGETTVRDSRPSGDAIRRRRLCLKCGERFTTFETISSITDEKALANAQAQMKVALEAMSAALVYVGKANSPGLPEAEMRLIRAAA